MMWNKRVFSLILVIIMVFSSMTVFAKNNGRGKLSIDDMDLSKLKWIEEPKFGEVKNKKVEVYGKMQIPKEFKGTTIVKLEVNGFNVVPMKDGSFSKSIFINSEVNIKVFVGKDEVVDLGKTLIYLEDTTKVDKVEAMIEALPKVEDIKLNDKEAVRKARLAYEALTDMEKKAVKNLDKLIAAEKRIAELEQKEEKVKLTLLGEGLSSNPVAGEINKGTEVIVTAAVPKDKVVDKFIVNGANKKHMLVDNKYKFVIEKDTVIFVNYKEAEKGNVHIGLYKDSVVASNGIDFEYIIDSFYIENKETGERYTEGTSPWSAKRNYQMKDIPAGEYTIHFKLPKGMYVHQIQLGESYKETVYNPETNPLVVVDKGSSSNYVKITLRSETTLKEIKPLDDIVVPVNITYEDFKEALPKKATIVDSNNVEHEVELRWDIRPYNFENYKKPGTITLWSDFFKLPLEVSNTIPGTRLEVKLGVTFK